MDMRTLEYIAAIAREQSIRRAADCFLVSPAVLSRKLQQEEKRLGTPLFTRSGKKMIMTDAGRIYVNGAQMMLSVYKNARQKLEKEKENQRGGRTSS